MVECDAITGQVNTQAGVGEDFIAADIDSCIGTYIDPCAVIERDSVASYSSCAADGVVWPSNIDTRCRARAG